MIMRNILAAVMYSLITGLACYLLFVFPASKRSDAYSEGFNSGYEAGKQECSVETKREMI